MHPYSTDESRVSVYGGLAVLSVVLSWAIVAATARLSWPEWLVSAPSLAGTFAVLYRAFDRYAWRWRWLHKLGVVKVSDVSGTYAGKLVSTYQDPAGKPVERDITLDIAQTWTRLSVFMTVISGSSSSTSISAHGSVTHDGSATCLAYTYRNKVNPAVADADMGDHDGAADLRIDDNGRLSGRYFNSRPRAGSIEGQRQ